MVLVLVVLCAMVRPCVGSDTELDDALAPTQPGCSNRFVLVRLLGVVTFYCTERVFKCCGDFGAGFWHLVDLLQAVGQFGSSSRGMLS